MTGLVRWNGAAVLLAWACPACQSADAPPGALEPVSCDALPAAPSSMVEAAEASEIPMTDNDLSSGQSQVLLHWSDEAGERWLLTEPIADADIAYLPEGREGEWWPVWGVGAHLPCDPESGVMMWFALEDGTYDPLSPGDYPLSVISFDVPEREQGDGTTSYGEGFVTITEAGDGQASGYLAGRGGGSLISYFTQEDIGVEYEVYGLGFQDIPAEWVLGDEQ
jgi:hypothetical protein